MVLPICAIWVRLFSLPSLLLDIWLLKLPGIWAGDWWQLLFTCFISAKVKFHLNFDSCFSYFVSRIFFDPQQLTVMWCETFFVITIGVIKQTFIMCLFPCKWYFYLNKLIVLSNPFPLTGKGIWGSWTPVNELSDSASHLQDLSRLAPRVIACLGR